MQWLSRMLLFDGHSMVQRCRMRRPSTHHFTSGLRPRRALLPFLICLYPNIASREKLRSSGTKRLLPLWPATASPDKGGRRRSCRHADRATVASKHSYVRLIGCSSFCRLEDGFLRIDAPKKQLRPGISLRLPADRSRRGLHLCWFHTLGSCNNLRASN